MSTELLRVDCQNLLSTGLLQVVSTSCNKSAIWQVPASLILTDLLQFDEIDKFCWKMKQAGKINNLQLVCSIFGYVYETHSLTIDYFPFQMLLLIVLFCMAFASTFYLLFAEQDRFSNYPIAVLSTFVSMLGDFSYDDLFVAVGDYKDFHSFKLGMFVVFVLLMVVVVNNVLIGLAVGDTEYVMAMAKVQRLRQHVSIVNLT